MNAKESITTFLRTTNFRLWRERGTTFLGKLNVRNAKEAIWKAEEAIGDAEESITSFFRRTDRKRETAYIGKLDGEVVAASQPVIIFEYPHILHSTDNVEAATAMQLELNERNKSTQAAVYKYDANRWLEVVDNSLCAGASGMRTE